MTTKTEVNPPVKIPKRFKWTVEFEVDQSWVADGFDLDDERALDMLSNDLQYAHIGNELGARVVVKPSKASILWVQGYEEEAIAASKGKQS